MASSNINKIDQNKSAKHSDPINISPSANFRRRSASISSSSSGSGSSPEVSTPTSLANSQRISIPSPSTSPILSYFLGQSPSKSTTTGAASTFPFKRKFGSVPVYEDEEPEQEIPVAVHARRASATVAGRLLQNPPIPDPQHERGTNTLRRLSLSSGFIRPQVSVPSGRTQSPPPLTAPPNTAVSPTPDSLPFQRAKPSRSATICNDGRKPRRVPSPMGERILKGHFDGFN